MKNYGYIIASVFFVFGLNSSAFESVPEGGELEVSFREITNQSAGDLSLGLIVNLCNTSGDSTNGQPSCFELGRIQPQTFAKGKSEPKASIRISQAKFAEALVSVKRVNNSTEGVNLFFRFGNSESTTYKDAVEAIPAFDSESKATQVVVKADDLFRIRLNLKNRPVK